jgi:hypothetical protein
MIQEVGGEVGQEDEAGGEANATQQLCCLGRTDLVKITTASMPHEGDSACEERPHCDRLETGRSRSGPTPSRSIRRSEV